LVSINLRYDVISGIYETSSAQNNLTISFPSRLATREDEILMTNLDRIAVEVLNKDQGDSDLIRTYYINKSSILEDYYPTIIYRNGDYQPHLRLKQKFQ